MGIRTVDYGIRLHLIAEDISLLHQLNFFVRHYTRWRVTHSVGLFLADQTNLLLIPAYMLLEFRRYSLDQNLNHAAGIPIVAFGDAIYSPVCFMGGCDDFLKVPWTFEELFYRIQKLIVPSICIVPELRLRISPNIAECGSHSIALSFLEYRLLSLLVRNIGKPLSRSVIFRQLFDTTVDESRSIDVYISKVRKKLREIMPRYTAITAIRTIRGFGYEMLI